MQMAINIFIFINNKSRNMFANIISTNNNKIFLTLLNNKYIYFSNTINSLIHFVFFLVAVSGGPECLPVNLVLLERLEAQDVKNGSMVCTSCKAGDKAEYRCSDCSTYLCHTCLAAHKFMKCFNDHKVTSIITFLI